jgi:hypothetical protein
MDKSTFLWIYGIILISLLIYINWQQPKFKKNEKVVLTHGAVRSAYKVHKQDTQSCSCILMFLLLGWFMALFSK